MELLYILAATIAVSGLSLFGAAWLTLKSKQTQKLTFWLVSLAAGTLMGAAFWHLIPEAIEEIDVMSTMTLVVGSFVGFYVIEKLLHWQHCHDTDCEVHSFGYLNLVGDVLHNFLDGITIAAAFAVNPVLGINTTLAIALHEIPQELGDIGVLLHAGFTRKTALLANLGVALTAILGGLVGYALNIWAAPVIPYLLPIAAGGFLYIASSDLIPELRQEKDPKRSFFALAWFLAGLGVMYLALFTEAG